MENLSDMEVLRISEDEVSDEDFECGRYKDEKDEQSDETRNGSRDELRQREMARDKQSDIVRDEKRDLARDKARDEERDKQREIVRNTASDMQKEMTGDKAIGIEGVDAPITPEPVLTVEKVMEVFNRIKKVNTPAINSKLAVPFKKLPVKDSIRFKQDYSEVKENLRKISGGLGKSAYQDEKKRRNSLPFPWSASLTKDTEGSR